MQIQELGYRSVLMPDAVCAYPDGPDGILLLLTGAPMRISAGGQVLHAEER